MARGPARNPALIRYDAAPCQPAIYVAEGSGIVKVGQAFSARTRMQALHRQFERMGLTLGRFYLFPMRFINDLHKHEYAALKAVSAHATKLGRHREYFTGITFDAAVAVVRASLPT